MSFYLRNPPDLLRFSVVVLYLFLSFVFIMAMHQSRASTTFKRICVFCGSSSGKKIIYTEVAQELGQEMVKRGIDLVYGGGSIGLMGKVAQTVQDAGGHVVGVIPKSLMPKEICGNTVGELIAVDNMHQRKAEMARRADAFIALPGGYGTLEEVLEIITWAQLGIHSKPVGLLNVDGYYDEVLAFFDKALEQSFLNLASRQIVVSAPTAPQLLDKLEVYTTIEDETVPTLTWGITTPPAESITSSKTPRAALHQASATVTAPGTQCLSRKARSRSRSCHSPGARIWRSSTPAIDKFVYMSPPMPPMSHISPPAARYQRFNSCPSSPLSGGSGSSSRGICASIAPLFFT